MSVIYGDMSSASSQWVTEYGCTLWQNMTRLVSIVNLAKLNTLLQ